ncbi:hypothetical protein RR46_00946 [Papilio xuthus]|uniref:Uncharacterized protein n=1 Tax=Papilio xuthus TaxID=66420 RepID=A0A0N1IMW5_PAPXU|nr:hypothetical protein RR46_00946 [Papilio xuthus]
MFEYQTKTQAFKAALYCRSRKAAAERASGPNSSDADSRAGYRIDLTIYGLIGRTPSRGERGGGARGLDVEE